MQNLIISYIGDSCSEFLPLSFDSIKDIAEKIIFVWGMKDIETKKILDKYKEELKNKLIVIESEYNQEYKGQNGKQRNIYLKYLQTNHKGDLNLTLDPDEVIDDRFKDFLKSKEIETMTDNHILSIHMRHTIRDLATEDATVEQHFVHNRMFKVNDDLFYPESEHPVLISKSPDVKYGYTNMFTIWHLGSSREMFAIKKKYDNHRQKSEMHTPQFLRQWLNWHLFGTYPCKRFDPRKLPSIVKKHFEIIDDEIYFEGRGLENKHWIDCNHFIEYFQLRKEENKGSFVIFVGDGIGVRTFAMRAMGINAYGFDISEWAVKNNLGKFPFDIYWQDDITNLKCMIQSYLIVIYDVLEHIDYNDLDKALDNIYNLGTKHFIFSIPFKGENPDLYKDATHKIFEERIWWVEKLKSHGFKIKETPLWFQYSSQLIIGKKK